MKPIAHFSSHRFLIHFVNINTDKQIAIWRVIYERLVITSIQRRAFQRYYTDHNTTTDYQHYDPTAFKMEFLRSRWNLDEIMLHDSHAAYTLLIFGKDEGHLPTSIERRMNRHNNVSDFIHRLKMYYRVVSGRGHRCTHATRLEKLKSLTENFNAYDRIFCDAFEYHDIPSEGYWNSDDIFYHRGHLIRDDILSAFPPDAKAVYYASPMITFVVLQREPVTWIFIFRPFPNSLWGLIVLILLTLKGAKAMIKVAGTTQNDVFDLKSLKIRKRYRNALEIITGFYRIIIMSAYSGMILLGILYPIYSWIPDTFTGLNYTKNYKVCTSFDAPIKDTFLIEKFKLNAVPREMWKVRSERYPAQYLASQNHGESSESENRNDSKSFYATLMYDDKMNLWLKGREFLPLTHSFFEKIKPAKEHVLAEIRYASIAAGATRLHFVLETIKRGFTSGLWMRYHYLEINYYKNVAPLIVKRLNMEKAIAKGKQGSMNGESSGNRRALTTYDLYSSFIVNVVGLAVAYLFWMMELCSNRFIERAN